jgi:hypothetical protein
MTQKNKEMGEGLWWFGFQLKVAFKSVQIISISFSMFLSAIIISKIGIIQAIVEKDKNNCNYKHRGFVFTFIG